MKLIAMEQNEYAIGIDLGGTSIKYALVDKEGSFLYQGRVPSLAHTSAESVIAQLVKVVEETKAFAQKNSWRIKGVGIGTPGIIDRSNRIVLGGSDNIKGWENLPLAGWMEKYTGMPVLLGNDANLMGLGETCYGAGKGFTHIVFLTIGTGIGGAIVIDGKLFCGYANRGTELGHIPLFADGKVCSCGATGCLESYASTSALVRRFIGCISEEGITYPNEEINGELIVRLYKEGKQPAVRCLDDHCYYLGRGIAGFINIFSPQKIIIGGGLSEAGDFYIQKISNVAFHYAMKECAQNTEIMAAVLGNKAGCLGAASLVFSALP